MQLPPTRLTRDTHNIMFHSRNCTKPILTNQQFTCAYSDLGSQCCSHCCCQCRRWQWGTITLYAGSGFFAWNRRGFLQQFMQYRSTNNWRFGHGPPSADRRSLWLKPAVVHWSILRDLPPFQTFYNAVMSLYTITLVVTSWLWAATKTQCLTAGSGWHELEKS